MGWRNRPEPEPEMADVEGAAKVDANLAQVKQRDRDAARIFIHSATDSLRSSTAQDRFAEQVKAYAKAKSEKGEMNLYYEVFRGI